MGHRAICRHWDLTGSFPSDTAIKCSYASECFAMEAWHLQCWFNGDQASLKMLRLRCEMLGGLFPNPCRCVSNDPFSYLTWCFAWQVRESLTLLTTWSTSLFSRLKTSHCGKQLGSIIQQLKGNACSGPCNMLANTLSVNMLHRYAAGSWSCVSFMLSNYVAQLFMQWVWQWLYEIFFLLLLLLLFLLLFFIRVRVCETSVMLLTASTIQ